MSSDRPTPLPLEDRLRDLGGTLTRPVDADRLAEQVVARLADPEPAERSTARKPKAILGVPPSRGRRLAAAVIAAVLVGLALTPPVRAAVADWFGVIVQSGPALPGEPVPSAESDLTVDPAAEIVTFDPIVPSTLGDPSGVEVSDDERVLSMSWSTSDGTLRLDEFEGAISPGYVKRTADVEFVTVDGAVTLWFDQPHELVPVDVSGEPLAELARPAGPTLVWVVDDVTLRLEGMDKDSALEIAGSVLRNR